MVLDEYRQAYVGATDACVGIQKRIKQHWTGTKPFDRLIWGDPRHLDPLGRQLPRTRHDPHLRSQELSLVHRRNH